MHVIYEALKKTGGKTDAEALTSAARGMSFDSPRGKMTIDKDTRDIVQTLYVRRVQNVGGNLVNVVFDRVPDVKDPGSAGKK
jgi:branched-chain amino acid transport system substrate-binding protein